MKTYKVPLYTGSYTIVTNRDMVYTDDEWEALSESQRQEALRIYTVTLNSALRTRDKERRNLNGNLQDDSINWLR